MKRYTHTKEEWQLRPNWIDRTNMGSAGPPLRCAGLEVQKGFGFTRATGFEDRNLR
jgi:hypothetical protein